MQAMKAPSGSEHRVRVDRGRVACRRLGDVDLDRCRECVYLERLELAGRPGALQASYVVCSGAVPTDDVAFAW